MDGERHRQADKDRQKQTGRQTHRPTETETETEAERVSERLTDRSTEKERYQQPDKRDTRDARCEGACTRFVFSRFTAYTPLLYKA